MGKGVRDVREGKKETKEGKDAEKREMKSACTYHIT